MGTDKVGKGHPWDSALIALSGSQEIIWFMVDPMTLFWFFQSFFLLSSWSDEGFNEKNERKKENLPLVPNSVAEQKSAKVLEQVLSKNVHVVTILSIAALS